MASNPALSSGIPASCEATSSICSLTFPYCLCFLLVTLQKSKKYLTYKPCSPVLVQVLVYEDRMNKYPWIYLLDHFRELDHPWRCIGVSCQTKNLREGRERLQFAYKPRPCQTTTGRIRFGARAAANPKHRMTLARSNRTFMVVVNFRM